MLMLAALLVLPAAGGSPLGHVGGYSPSGSRSPSALAVNRDASLLFAAWPAANRIAVVALPSGRILDEIEVPESPVGLALSEDDAWLVVCCAAPRSLVGRVDLIRRGRVDWIPAGHTAVSPVLSRDGRRLYVCNRFENSVSVIDLELGQETGRVSVPREPIAAALTPEGRHLVVAGHLPEGRADRATAAAGVVVVDVAEARVVAEIGLRPGSGLARGIAVSPDGDYAAVTHILAHYHWIPRMAYLGWINQNAVSLIDLRAGRLLGTVPLDEEGRGAANPWAVDWTPDGGTLCVTHAGTHEVSLIDAEALIGRLEALPERIGEAKPGRTQGREHYNFPRFGAAACRFDLPSDFGFLRGIRRRVPAGGIGPRTIATSQQAIYVGNAFSDSVGVVEFGPAAEPSLVGVIPFGTASNGTPERLGERWFNDATLCVQGWQSCASCHDADARCDGLNWDLLNDGAHNPKNTRSLLYATRTPPMMALGVRANAAVAVHAGLRYSLFGEPSEPVGTAIVAYLDSLAPVPSPRLRAGRLSAEAERGRVVFERADVGCAACHPAPWFTDLARHDVGTAGDYDGGEDRFDTPSLRECWRTGPYLHDGSAASVREVLTTRNPGDGHGRVSGLSPSELTELVDYVLSL